MEVLYMFQFTLISVSGVGLKFVDEAVHRLKKDAGAGLVWEQALKVSFFYIGEAGSQREKMTAMAEAVAVSDFLFLDLMGASSGVVELLEKETEKYTGNLAVMGAGTQVLRERVRLGAFSFAKMAGSMGRNKQPMGMKNMDLNRLEAMSGIGGKLSRFSRGLHHWLMLQRAWTHAGTENIYNMVLLILREYGGFSTLSKPGKITDYADHVLVHPGTGKGYKSLAAFKKDHPFDKSKPSLGLLFSSANYPYYHFDIMADIMERMSQDFNCIPLGVHTGDKKFKRIEEHLAQGMTLDLVWDFLPFRFGAGPMGGNEEMGPRTFKRFDVPVLHPFFMNRRRITDWENDLPGLGPAETIICTMLPEMDGVTDTIPLGGLAPAPSLGMPDMSAVSLIHERFDRLRSKSLNMIRLRRLQNSEKRVAVIIYNYPPGEGNVGGGAFLDTFKSVESMIIRLKQEGYTTRGITAEQMEEIFMTRGQCNSPRWTADQGRGIKFPYDRCPEVLTHNRETNRAWGSFPGQIMADETGFAIPGILEGNVFLGLQPSRGTDEDPDKNYHDKSLPPHHQYAAFYHWLKHEFKAHAVVHVGTHGTLEFLPGKENAMSGRCCPDMLMGDLPHFYFYHAGNPSEATIAKRRSHACLISYSGPGFRKSGAYGEMADLEALIEEYESVEPGAEARRAEIYGRIVKGAGALSLLPDDPEDVDAIAAELVRMKTCLMPLGLHCLGSGFKKQEVVSFLGAILAWDTADLPALPGLLFSALDPDVPGIQQQEAAWDMGLDLIDRVVLDKDSLPMFVADRLNREELVLVNRQMDRGRSCLELIRQTDELGGLMRCLGGGFLPARLGGDLIRDPDIFPTGNNLFQFDARKVPSATAMDRGRRVALSTLSYFKATGKDYPESVSVVLWGLETSRTRGETIGQILAYLGVDLVSVENAWEKKFRLIPLSELDRPRIDVVVSLCGFFRDMFPNMIDFLDEVFEAVCLADEPEELNFCKAHSRQTQAELEKNLDKKEAKALSMGRLFGPARGEYGTGLTTVVAQGSWKDESELARGFISAQKHLYTRSRKGQAQPDLFRAELSRVDLVSQVRSSVDYSIADLDHYYEYFGGLSRSVEEVRGKKPVMLYTDSSSSTMYTDEAQKAVNISVRTRLLNPDYINALLDHQVHGAQHLADRVKNLIGLSVTTGRVDSWIFSAVKQTFLDDRAMAQKLKENNAFALLDMAASLLEARQRGYWDATDDEIRDLEMQYLDMEGEVEEKIETMG